MSVYWFVCPNIYLDVILFQFLVLFREEITFTSRHFVNCRLGLPVVHERSSVVSMKSIIMYILHDSSLVVSFSNISAYFA